MSRAENLMQCSSCGLKPEEPNFMKDHGQCASCEMMRRPGWLEGAAANNFPPCFEPTRAAFVAMAALALEMRGGARN